MSNNNRNRLACLYNNKLRNDGSPLYVFNVLKNQLKLDVIHLLPEGDVSRFGKMKAWFWVDYGEDGFDPIGSSWLPPKDGGKTIYVASDTHLGQDYRFEKATKFNYVYFNQKDAVHKYLDWMIVNGKKHNNLQEPRWLPHAVEPQAYPRFSIVKKYDVAFIGHMQTTENYNGLTRIDALDRLFKEFPNFYFGSRTPLDPTINLFEDAAKKFSQSRIVFNISIKDDLNMRVFESMATGSMLLTNWIPTLGELFEDGKHLVTYKTYDEMIEKARYYLEHEEEREKIAQAGYEEVIAKHTYRHRVESVLQQVCL